MKVRFAVSAYRSKNVAMHCRTEDEADTFLKYLHSIGRHWLSGRRAEKTYTCNKFRRSGVFLKGVNMDKQMIVLINTTIEVGYEYYVEIPESERNRLEEDRYSSGVIYIEKIVDDWVYILPISANFALKPGEKACKFHCDSLYASWVKEQVRMFDFKEPSAVTMSFDELMA